MDKVFLGGTCNESLWRNKMMVYLYDAGLEYFNPVVDDWTPGCMEEELRQREICDWCLYTIYGQWKSLNAVARLVKQNGAASFDNLKAAALYIEKRARNGKD